MQKRELVITTLNEMGLKTNISSSGDIYFFYEMKSFIIPISEQESNYIVVLFYQFEELDKQNPLQTLTICNKMTRELRMVKVYVEETFDSVSASCEFYYKRKSDLKENLEKSLEIFSVLRTAFIMNKNALDKELEGSNSDSEQNSQDDNC